jgi:anti-sigma factor RsiW
MHLTDEQLNEYLDNETTERAQIETHLASCADCAARLIALQVLFAEIESLPEVELAPTLAHADGVSASRARIDRADRRRAVCDEPVACH